MKRTLLAGLLLALAGASAADSPDVFVPGTDNDPRVRETDLLQTEQRYYTSSAELLRLQAETPQQRLSPEFYRRLAESTLSFGMRVRADQIYRELLAGNADPVPQFQGRIRLAEFLHQRGYEQDSVQDLRALRQNLPQDLERDWQDTLSRALLGQGRYSEAVEALSDSHLHGELSQYGRYNLGVALILDGRVGQGVNELDRVGRFDAKTEEEQALRDQANLLLGYHFLRQSQGTTAVPVFERVRSQGAVSNRALLGLGWAFLAPQGSSQKKVAVGDEGKDDDKISPLSKMSTIGVLLRPGFLDQDVYRRIGLGSFKRERGSDSDELNFKRALVPWLELAGRDPIDQTVQEGLLAIPYCLERLGAHKQAQQFYEKAIAALDAARKRIDLTIYYVKSGRMLQTMILRTQNSEAGWTWALNDLPNGDETFYLQRLIAGNRFQEQTKNYRDVLMMQHSLETWLKRFDQVQSVYMQPSKREEVPTATLFAEAAAQRAPTPRAPAQPATVPDAPALPTPTLKTDEALSVPDPGKAPEAPPAEPPVLQVAKPPVPAAFIGTYERIEQLRARIAVVQPKLAAAADRQGGLIEALVLDDMQRQKRVTEKYLIEARFAVARIYDKQLKGGGQ